MMPLRNTHTEIRAPSHVSPYTCFTKWFWKLMDMDEPCSKRAPCDATGQHHLFEGGNFPRRLALQLVEGERVSGTIRSRLLRGIKSQKHCVSNHKGTFQELEP